MDEIKVLVFESRGIVLIGKSDYSYILTVRSMEFFPLKQFCSETDAFNEVPQLRT